eukprot:g6993.t1
MKFWSCCSLLALAGGAQAAGGLRSQRDLQTYTAEWTYRSTGTPGEEPYGPEDWYLGYPDCAGTRQSPINLSGPVVEVVDAATYPLEFGDVTCHSSELSFTSNYAVWQVGFDGCSTVPYLTYKGEQYNLLQFHIHSPSEYTFGGSEKAADIHFVHLKDGVDDVQLLVVGLLFDITEIGDNLELENFWSVLDTGKNTTDVSFTTNPYHMLPVSRSFTHFMGSLTTPPCSEGVKWIVMNELGYMGRRQIEDYRRAVALYDGSKVSEFGNTNRPIQALNDRTLNDWHLGYPGCGLTIQSPINIAVDLSTVVKPVDNEIEFTQNFCDSSELTFKANYAVWQIGGAEHAADIHMVHVKNGTDSELLVVGVMFDVSEYGTNLEPELLAIHGVAHDASFLRGWAEQGVTWIVMNEPSFWVGGS